MDRLIFEKLGKIYRNLFCIDVKMICNRENNLNSIEGEFGTEIITSNLPESLETQKETETPEQFSIPKHNSIPKTTQLQTLNQNEDFWTAVEIGDFDACNTLLSTSPQINLEYRKNGLETLLHLSSRLGHLKICLLLLKNGSDPTAIDSSGRTPLHLACKYDHYSIIKVLLKFNPPLNTRDSLGKTPLDYSRLNRNPKTMKILQNPSNSVNKVSLSNPDIKLSVDCDTSLISNLDLTSTTPIETFPQITISDFKTHKPLGKGRFAQVFLVSHKPSGQLFALKILQKSKILSENLINHSLSEKSILSKISHPFIVKLHYAFQSDDELYLVLSYYSGGTLSDYLKAAQKFSESTAKFYICEIILALEELHSHSVVYRDLKPDNILIDGNGHAGLTDFNLSKQGISDNDVTHSFCGSSAYMPPEILLQSGHNKSVDWYLLGVLFYELLTGFPPFYTFSRQKLMENILEKKLQMPDGISEQCQDLIQGLMKRDPKERIGYNGDADEVKSHEFFKDVDWESVYNKEINAPIIVKSFSTPLYVVPKPVIQSPVSCRHKFNWTFASP